MQSEDERDESIASESDTSSLPPPTPPTPMCMEDQATQTTSYTEDGVFKIPPPKTAEVSLMFIFSTKILYIVIF